MDEELKKEFDDLLEFVKEEHFSYEDSLAGFKKDPSLLVKTAGDAELDFYVSFIEYEELVKTLRNIYERLNEIKQRREKIRTQKAVENMEKSFAEKKASVPVGSVIGGRGE